MLLLAGCSAVPGPVRRPLAAAPSTAATPTGPGVQDPAAQVCREVRAAVAEDRTGDAQLLLHIAETGAQAADEGVAWAARLLHDRAEILAAAAGAPDEPRYRPGAREAADGLVVACTRAGL